MKKHYIFRILKTFDETELRSFQKFLQSSFITRSNRLTQAYKFIVNFAPEFNSSYLTKTRLHEKLKPGKVYSDEYVRNILFQLLQMLQKFLMYQNFESREEDSHDFLRNELLLRGLYGLAEKDISLSLEGLNKYSVDSSYYLSSFKLVTDNYNLKHFTNKFKGEKGLKLRLDLITQRAMDLISFFLIEILKTNYMLLNFTRNTGIEVQSNFARRFIDSLNIWQIIKELKNTDEKRSKVFELYYNLFLCFNDLNDEHYFDMLYKSVKQNGRILSKDEQNFFYRRMLDYSIIKFRSKTRNVKFDKYLFELFDNFVYNKIYITSRSKFIPIQLFRNFVHFGIESRKYKWTEETINTCRLKLSPEYRKNMYSYALSMLYYEKGLHKKALDESTKMRNLDNFLFRLDAKMLTLRIDYDTGNTGTLISNIDTFNHFIKSSKNLSLDRKVKLKNFSFILEKLIKLQVSCNARALKYLNKELRVKKTEHMDWLKEKLRYYENRFSATG